MGCLLQSWLLCALAAAAPGEAAPSSIEVRYLFRWKEVPVGTVELAWERELGRYTYRSRHLFTRSGDRASVLQERTFPVEPTKRVQGQTVVPEGLWLLEAFGAPGCAEVREELGGRSGQACAREVSAGHARGTLLGEPFEAGYDSQGVLEWVALGDSRFERMDLAQKVAFPPDLFGEGLPVEGAGETLVLEPALAPEPDVGALPEWEEREFRAVVRQAHEAFPEKRPGPADLAAASAEGAGSCLAHVHKVLALARERGKRVAVVHGLWADRQAGRAYPHVWVRARLKNRRVLDLDPTSLDPVRSATHLPIAAFFDAGGREPGALWRRLFGGGFKVIGR